MQLPLVELQLCPANKFGECSRSGNLLTMNNFETRILSWESRRCYFIRDYGEGRLRRNEAGWRSGENSRVEAGMELNGGA